MASRIIAAILITLIVICFATSVGVTAEGYWNSSRDYEPVVLKGLDIKNIVSVPINQIYLYKYNLAENLWTPIPFQIDQKDDSSHYWLPAPNDTLDTNDEVVFMARDMGDKAPDNTFWINDPESRKNERIELAVIDTLDSRQAWIYIYQSKTSLALASESYMSYSPDSKGAGADTVFATTYIEGNSDGGIQDYWSLPLGSGVDILDRLKVRLGMLLYNFIPFTAREDLLETYFVKIEKKVGPVRVIRDVFWNIDLSSLGVDPFLFDLLLYYYPYSIESGGVSGTFQPDDHITLIRQSFDLNPAASGMKFYNPNNVSGLTIDGSGNSDGIDDSINDSPEVNWYLITGSQGTVAFVFSLSPIGKEQVLYYHDNNEVLKEEEDTGDRMSWGDTGIEISGKDISGRISYNYQAFYLEANRAFSLGDSLAANFKSPMKISVESNFYVPVELATFRAIETEGKVLLEWITESELNNFGFDIQRKADEKSGWQQIGFIEGKGTTATPQKYTFTDESVSVGAYYYRLKQIDFDGSFEFSDELFIEIQPPKAFVLYQNYPNPFNPETIIHYRIPVLLQASVPVEIKIFNLLGDEVRTLVKKDQGSGYYSVKWDSRNDQGENVAAGTYIYQLKAGNFKQSQKLLLLR
ncbi:T9SS type A sorting domain-containing protein [candidate division KSB1 bacterium]|nr:T9SS type A sorting domain-containing protein [candidate division KSB1 bacterium]